MAGSSPLSRCPIDIETRARLCWVIAASSPTYATLRTSARSSGAIRRCRMKLWSKLPAMPSCGWVALRARPDRGSCSVPARTRPAHLRRVLQVSTTEPGLQFYDGHLIDGATTGVHGRVFDCYAGLRSRDPALSRLPRITRISPLSNCGPSNDIARRRGGSFELNDGWPPACSR